jgi:hypothetical protein
MPKLPQAFQFPSCLARMERLVVQAGTKQIGRGGGDRIYQAAESKGILRNVL